VDTVKRERGRQNVQWKKRIRNAMGQKQAKFNKLQVTTNRTVLSNRINHGTADLSTNFPPNNKPKLFSECSAMDTYPILPYFVSTTESTSTQKFLPHNTSANPTI
jgi:hypothetical protein